MRIAHFFLGRCNPDSANGVNKSVYFSSKTQAAHGHEVAVWSITTKAPLPLANVEQHAYLPTRMPFRLPEQLLDDLLRWQPSIVHMHSVYIPAGYALTHHLRARGVPYVVSPHGALSPFVLRRRPYIKLPYKLLLERRCLNRAAFVHAVSDNEAADIRRYGVSAPIVVAPNAIDPASIPRDLDAGLLRARFPAVRGKRVLLFIGRLDPLQKGLDLLFHAMAQARPALARTALVLVGPEWRGGGQRAALEQLAASLGIASQVVFAGPVYGADKYAMLAGADVFVQPSRFEGMPNAVLEALMCGKPCLISDATGLGRYVADADAGLVTRPETNAIAKGLAQFARMSEQRLYEMARNSKRLATTTFTWDATAQHLIGAYTRATGAKLPPRASHPVDRLAEHSKKGTL